MSGDNRGNDDGGTTPSPGLQPLPEIAGELEHIGPASGREHAWYILVENYPNILDFDDRNEWNSRDSLDFFDKSSN